jgi:hypothetical protein
LRELPKTIFEPEMALGVAGLRTSIRCVGVAVAGSSFFAGSFFPERAAEVVDRIVTIPAIAIAHITATIISRVRRE